MQQISEWINILRCPISRESLHLVPGNTALLENESQTWIYPVFEGIPVLLKASAIDKTNGKHYEIAKDKEKLLVQDFYNEEGWESDHAGSYTDALIYEDLREVSRKYVSNCHKRLSRHLPPNGKYLLDAASGAIQFNELLAYSENFQYRICVDFSMRALKEARLKLGDKGIYVLCDLTDLPFQDDIIDAFISLNTIYHIPEAEQAGAVAGLYRVLQPGGKGVVVYDWFNHSIWMNITLLPFRAITFIRNRITGTKGKGGRLYFYAHTLEYFRKHLPPFRLFVWRSVSVPFMRTYIHKRLLGKAILRFIYSYEEAYPEICGTNGEYPMLVFEKPNLV